MVYPQQAIHLLRRILIAAVLVMYQNVIHFLDLPGCLPAEAVYRSSQCKDPNGRTNRHMVVPHQVNAHRFNGHCPAVHPIASAPLVLSSCSRTVSSSEATAPASSVVQEQVSPAKSEDLAGSAAPSDESWKAAFEKSLWENYNVTPEYYEDLGDGVYQVYVKIDGKTVPYVCVDSATGDYHG